MIFTVQTGRVSVLLVQGCGALGIAVSLLQRGYPELKAPTVNLTRTYEPLSRRRTKKLPIADQR